MTSNTDGTQSSQRILVAEGEWQGWHYSTGDAFMKLLK